MLGLLLLRRRRRAAMLRAGQRTGRAVDERMKLAAPLREQLNKAFPEHWSFMLGEVTLYSFVILILTGTFLTFFYEPSDQQVVYHGSYQLLSDVPMSKAYASTLDISFDVRMGLLVRQMHHWAALLFLGAMMLHLCRIFFTGAFRKPRELNWLIGLAMMMIAMVEGYCGYALPDDLLSGAGLRIASAVVLSIPVIGTWLQFLIFGGEYPGHQIFERLYIVHVLLFPGLLVALIATHLVLVIHQKHTDFATAGVLAGLGGLAQINPVFQFGPYEPQQVSSDSQPDFYVWFLDGALRLFPPWEIRVFHHDVPNVFWAGVVTPLVLFVLAGCYPWIEARWYGDRAKHNVLERPRDNPRRSGLGAMALSFFVILSLAAAQDLIAHLFRTPVEGVVWMLRIGLFVVPPIAFLLTRHICRRLLEHDVRLLAGGAGTGELRQDADGGWGEVAVPIESITAGDPEGLPYETRPIVADEQPVRR